MRYKEENIQIIKNFIEKDFVEFIQDYFSIKINSNQYNESENFTNGYEFYGDPLIETILQNCCESISELIEIKLLPTYSVTNMFMKDDLNVSSVNNFCEVSAILSLGSSNNNDNFLFEFNNNSEIILDSGDLVIFNNKKIKSIEKIITDTWVLQSRLNFVDAKGNYTNLIYDNRSYLGFPIQDK